jgi:hypothetical protein
MLAGVGDGRKATRGTTSVEAPGIVQFDAARFDGDRAPRRHCVARVDRQVDQDLVELTVVHPEPASHGPRLDHQPHLLPDQAPKHRLDAQDGLVEVDDLGSDHLATAEREQLRRQRCRPRCGITDRLHAAACVVGVEAVPPFGRQVLGEQLRVALDREQDVVEVMGDSARKSADRLQLLRLKGSLSAALRAEMSMTVEDAQAPGSWTGVRLISTGNSVPSFHRPARSADAMRASDQAGDDTIALGNVACSRALRQEALDGLIDAVPQVDFKASSACRLVRDPAPRSMATMGLGDTSRTANDGPTPDWLTGGAPLAGADRSAIADPLPPIRDSGRKLAASTGDWQ